MNYQEALPSIWFLLVGVLLTGYALLDGFDLGVGALHLFAKGDYERRVMLNSIGPVWDGNEVWLITGGGALFAAFPDVYATVFSGFYTAFYLLLVALIFRAIAIEFRSKEKSVLWRKCWDVAFSVSSILIPILMGVALGNMVTGIPVDRNMEFTGTFWTLFTPISLVTGVATLALFMMHGAIYVAMKTEDELQDRAKRWFWSTLAFFAVSYAALTVLIFLQAPTMVEKFMASPMLFALPVLNVLAILNVPREFYHKRESRAFFSSCCAIVALMTLFGLGLYPELVPSTIDAAYSLTIFNASSSTKTLHTMLIMAGIGMPFVIAYTIAIYYVFRGKVRADHLHY